MKKKVLLGSLLLSALVGHGAPSHAAVSISAKDIGGVLLTDAGLLACVTQPTCKFIAVDSHFLPLSVALHMVILSNRTTSVNFCLHLYYNRAYVGSLFCPKGGD